MVRDAAERVEFNGMRPDKSLKASIQNKGKGHVEVQIKSGVLRPRSNESRNKIQNLN